MGHVSHDWPDKENVKILKNIKSVMKDSSRILIGTDTILLRLRQLARHHAESRTADEYILQLAVQTKQGSYAVRQVDICVIIFTLQR